MTDSKPNPSPSPNKAGAPSNPPKNGGKKEKINQSTRPEHRVTRVSKRPNHRAHGNGPAKK